MDEPVAVYPKRAVPRDEDAAKALKKRTLTNLYNARATVARGCVRDEALSIGPMPSLGRRCRIRSSV